LPIVKCRDVEDPSMSIEPKTPSSERRRTTHARRWRSAMTPDEAFAGTPGPAELRSSRPRLSERSDCPFCRHHGPHRQAPVSAHQAGRRAVISRAGVLYAKGAHSRPVGLSLNVCTAVQPRQRTDLPRTGSLFDRRGAGIASIVHAHGPIAPGGEADRGSRLRRRAAQIPAGTPRCRRRPWRASGAGPEPGYELTVAHQHRRRQLPPARRPQRTLKLLQTASATLPPPRGAPGR
jgi:hypothetical protein